MRKQPHGGSLQSGNPHGGRRSAELEAQMLERAQEIAADGMAWDVQQARARAGDLRSLIFAKETGFGKAKEKTEVTGDVTVHVQYDDD